MPGGYRKWIGARRERYSPADSSTAGLYLFMSSLASSRATIPWNADLNWGGPSGRNFHLLDRTLEVALSAGHSCDFRVNDPVVRIPLDVGPEDLKCLRLLALALELASITVQLKCVSHLYGFVPRGRGFVFLAHRVENP